MTEYLFQLWFAATWQASVLACAVFFMTFLFRKRLQPRWRYLLWCIVLLRLAFPVLPETPWGIWSENVSVAVPEVLVNTPATFQYPLQNIPDLETGQGRLSSSNDISWKPVIETITPIEPVMESAQPSVGQRFKQAFLFIWFVGFVCLFGKYLLNEYRFLQQSCSWTETSNQELLALFEKCLKEVGMRSRVLLKTTSDPVGAGCFGFFRPVIVLSDMATKMSSNDLKMILLHELVHLKRMDPLVLRISTLLSMIHWPNPMVWLAFSRMQQEREPACDAAVLNLLGQQKQKDYGLAILTFAELFPDRKHLDALVGIFEKNGTVRRIDMIIKYKRSKWAHTLLGILLIALLASMGLTRAQTSTDKTGVDKTGTETPVQEVKLSEKKLVISTVDENGKSLPHVDIRVHLPDFKDNNRAKATDANGNMVLRLPDSPRELYISANSPGRVPQLVYWESEDMTSNIKIPETVTFTLPQGSKIGGIVVDQDGHPIEGALLQVIARPNGYGMPGHLKPADSHILAYGDGQPNVFGGVTSCKTDQKGSWALDNVPNGKFYPVEIEISHPEYILNDELGRSSFSLQNDSLIEKLRNGEYRFMMKRGVSVSGTVRNVEGKPIRDALVVPGGDAFYYTEDREKSVRTDADGKYQIHALRFGSGTITVLAEGYAPEMKKENFEANMQPIDFDLKSGKTIAFRFIDEKGKPVPKAKVNIGSNPDSWWREGSNIYNNARSASRQSSKIPVYANDEGVYRWDWAPEDKVRFSFHKNGFLMDFLSDKNWFVARSEPYEIVLHHQKTFRGSVVDSETNQPIKEFQIVYGTNMDERSGIQNIVWQTPQEQSFDATEMFQLTPIFKCDQYWLKFTADGYNELVSGPYPLDAEPPILNIALKRFGSNQKLLKGQVLLQSGKPAAHAEIILCREDEYVDITPPNISAMSVAKPRLIVTADEQGRFQMKCPTDEKDYRLYAAHSEGFAQMDKKDWQENLTLQLQPYGKIVIHLPYDTKPEAYNRFTFRRQEELTKVIENKKSVYKRKQFGNISYQGNIPPEGMVEIDSLVPGEYSFQKLARDNQTVYNVTNFYINIQSGETKHWELAAQPGVKVTARIRLPDDYQGEFTEADWRENHLSLSIKLDDHERRMYFERIRPSKNDSRQGVVEFDQIPPGPFRYNVMLSKPGKHDPYDPTVSVPSTFIGGVFQEITIPESTEDKSFVFDIGTIQIKMSKPKKD